MHPLRFRIQDFRSIVDTGWCNFSGDGITVLAGQNEAGKSAILMALRDFDLPDGDKPITQEYVPDDRVEASSPRVAVEFGISDADRVKWSLDDDIALPMAMWNRLGGISRLTIVRDLVSGSFSLDETVAKDWNLDDKDVFYGQSEDEEEDSGDDSEATAVVASDDGEGPVDATMSPSQFAANLRFHWPKFVYFDTFAHTLPRTILVSELENLSDEERAESSVVDFLALSGVDLDRVSALEANDKQLGNYLDRCVGHITGDFRTYWGQKSDHREQVRLVVRHGRTSSGALKLDFFVQDQSNQFPDQRSRGFLWFLSFYLRLAAAGKHDPDREQLLLIDEPGTYLHARAQKDVLKLFEERLAPKEKIVYTTHSPYLLPASGLHRVRIVVRDPDKGTVVYDKLTHPGLLGEGFSDALAPIVTAIGLDVRDHVGLVRAKNLVVEGISDYLYVTAWMRQYGKDLLDQINVFPATGAPTVPSLCSLLTGWGFEFAVLLDRDGEGLKAATRVKQDLLVSADRVLHPHDATTIEDMFSADDFRALVKGVDPDVVVEQGEKPSAAIKRLRIDKVLLARRYSELAGGELTHTKATKAAIVRLLDDCRKASSLS